MRGKSASNRRRPTGFRIMTGLVVVVVAMVLAACGGSSGTKSSGKTVHLTWWTMWSGAALTQVNEFVTKFNDTHPDIRVTTATIPSDITSSTAKLLSSIAAGQAPDVFTEWWPEIGSFAAKGDLASMEPYMTGQYAGYKKYLYPVALQGGSYKGSLYAAPMSLNSWALYYNKTILAKYGITSPPSTLAELDTDQAKMWETSPRLTQLGFYPNQNSFQFFTTYFGATNCIKGDKYDFADCPGAINEMNWIASYAKYPYSQVVALQTALGAVAGGQTDVFAAGKAGFILSGPWEGAQNIPTSNPGLKGKFGVESFPAPVGGPSTIGQGNFNIIPKTSKHPKQAFEFIAWLSGYQSASTIAPIDTQGGWVPGGPSVTKDPAYVSWLEANPYLKPFLPQMSSKATVAPILTPTQSQLFAAESNASNEVLQKQMTPMQALQYIDAQANG